MPDGDLAQFDPREVYIGEMVVQQYRQHVSNLTHNNFLLEARCTDLEQQLAEAQAELRRMATPASPPATAAPAPSPPAASELPDG